MNRLDKAITAWGVGKKTQGRLGVFSFAPHVLFDCQTAVACRTNLFPKPVVAVRKDALGAKIDSYLAPDRHFRGLAVAELEDAKFCTLVVAISALNRAMQRKLQINPQAITVLHTAGAALATLQSYGAIYGWGDLNPSPTQTDVSSCVIAGARLLLADRYDCLVMSPTRLRGHSRELGNKGTYFYVMDYDHALLAKMKHTGAKIINLRDQSF